MKPTKYSEDVRVLNDKLHSKRRLNTIQEVFKTHDLKKAVLYHFILSGSQSKAVYQATMKALIRHIRTKCRAEYMNAYEVGEEKGGLHCHMFIIIETAEHFPSDLLDVSQGEWISRRIKRTGLSIRIEPPKNHMHGGAMFAKMNTPEKLENCVNWCTYQLKQRSKEGVPGRETYSGSEFVSNIAKRESKRQKHRDALTKSSKPAKIESQQPSLPTAVLPAAEEANTQSKEETQNERCVQAQTSASSETSSYGTSESPACNPVHASSEAVAQAGHCSRIEEADIKSSPGIETQSYSDSRATAPLGRAEMTLTAAQKYVGSIYEQAVDLALDLDAMRRLLLDRRIKRTPLQIENDLENVYGFYRYAASHHQRQQ
jgi:hypothetical protein